MGGPLEGLWVAHEGQLAKDVLDARGRQLCARIAAEAGAWTVELEGHDNRRKPREPCLSHL